MRFCTLAKALKSMQSIYDICMYVGCTGRKGEGLVLGKASGKFVHMMTHAAAAAGKCEIFLCLPIFVFGIFALLFTF